MKNGGTRQKKLSLMGKEKFSSPSLDVPDTMLCGVITLRISSKVADRNWPEVNVPPLSSLFLFPPPLCPFPLSLSLIRQLPRLGSLVRTCCEDQLYAKVLGSVDSRGLG